MAALLGLNYYSTYQAEAPMRLESALDPLEKGSYSYELSEDQVSFHPMILEVVDDLQKGVSPGRIAGRFHRTLVDLVVDLAIRIRNEYGLDRVVLGGGTFQNRYLAEKVIDKLEKHRFQVYLPDRIPVNDQGIAAGQVAIGAYRRSNSQ
jgi:hydrogenase maturation protein HypF